MDKLLVTAHNGTTKIPLNCILNNTFYEHWEANNTWELQLTVYDDNSVAYNYLSVEASLYWDDQEFIIKQFEPDYTGGVTTIQIVATHVYAEISRIRQYNTKSGTLTYTPASVLSYYLDDTTCNTLGYTYEVIGTFDSDTITNLGNNSGQDMLSQILSTWPTAIIYPDNKNIRVYSADAFAVDHGNRIDYLHDTNEVTLTYDSTSIVNSVKCYGATEDTSSTTDDTDDDTETYYFTPFVVQDDDSVAEWGIHSGEDISDDRFTIAADMKAYALTQLVTEPSLSIEIKSLQNMKPIAGEIRRLEVRPIGYATKVQVLEYQYYPFDPSQETDIVLNNTAKTIIDYQLKLASNAANLVAQQKNKINSLTSTIDTLASTTSNLTSSAKTTAETIADLQAQIAALQSSSSSDSDSSWTSGSMFVDLSSNNGTTSTTDQAASWYTSLYSKGVKGAMIKLTQGSDSGTDYTNPIFDSQKANVISAGMKYIGSFHYFTATSVSNATAEATHFLEELQSRSIDKSTIVACDVEASGLSTDEATLTSELAAFFKVLADAGYSKTCIYASESWFTSGRFTFADTGAVYRWVAAWGSTKPTTCDAWQSADTFNGLSLDTDYSYNEAFV
ncbi:phage tail protein (plasmid) [Paucilactobacillus suebicus]|uniref:Minor structural protein n=1 Tax=Paucilactobacillus suebicus DSM 5007 = KCTC 3549 TaxID=1423807 RepID=A0A0R1VUA1_9LACO|nr:phage tail protein [Paucilactobacillus suebicus]KRM09352.1 minor structural protein [Paucilactobacillus suebicus DSM 5007 = KCTC 3549]